MPDSTPSQSARVLHGVDVVERPRAIAPPATIDDPAVQALLETVATKAHERGMQEGQAQGRAQAGAAATALAQGIEHALQASVIASASLADDLAGRIAGLAVDIAATVVAGLDLSDNGIVHRVEEALRVVDDRPLTVHVHPGEVDLLTPVCPPEVEVVAAADLAPGEARVVGRWADADLTWQAVWDSVREVLDAE